MWPFRPSAPPSVPGIVFVTGDGPSFEADAADVAALKNMPTKAELMQKVAVLIKRVPTKLALAVKAVPRKVAYGVKALADGDDDTTKTVGDVFPKAS